MELSYQPDFYLRANDKDITDVIKKSLVSLNLSDFSGEEIDQLSIVMSLPEGFKTPGKGAILQIGLGFAGAIIDKGKFIVDEIAINGPPRLIQIVAHAAPFISKTSSIQTQKTRSFENITLHDLVKKISAEHGLESKVSESVGVLKIEHIDQTNESDISLLSRLAKQNGVIVKPANESLLLLKKGEGKSVSGKPLLDVLIKPEMCTTWQCRFSSRSNAKQVTAIYKDLEAGDSKEVSIGTGEPAFKMAYLFDTKEQAIAAIKARIDDAEEGADTADISLAATHELMQLVAEGTMTMKGFGDLEDKKWKVKSIIFSLSDHGLSVRISANVSLKKQEHE